MKLISLKEPLFTARNILNISILVSGCLILVTGGTFLYGQFISNKSSIDDSQQNESKQDIAIKKAEKYLITNLGQIAVTERLLLDYLDRKYALNSSFGAQESTIVIKDYNAGQPEEIHYLARIAYPDKLVSTVPQIALEPLSILNVYSANCDHLPLPATFEQTVHKSISAGGYEMTHVALAFAFMKDNACSYPPIDELSEKVFNSMVNLANDPKTIADLRYEAVAFLLHSERGDLVKQDWIDQIISEQKPDGGWGIETGTNNNNSHATVLALWALLEYYHQSTADQPIIRRPSKI